MSEEYTIFVDKDNKGEYTIKIPLDQKRFPEQDVEKLEYPLKNIAKILGADAFELKLKITKKNG